MFGIFCILAGFLCPLVWSWPIAARRTQLSGNVPQYVLDYAPLVWLAPNEEFFPTDITIFLANVHAVLNGTDIEDAPSPLTPENLDVLKEIGTDVFLSTNDDFSSGPEWIKGTVPDSEGKTDGAISSAIIVHDRGNGSIDAFYFYFYGFNRGNTVLAHELGDHVGDWEHTMVRFENEIAQTIWLSAHAAGGAFQYSALEKQGDRAVVYSAIGSHANYATSGTHDHTIPGLPSEVGPLIDTTGNGTLWDPIKSAYTYTVSFPEGTEKDDSSSPSFASYDESSPTPWLSFLGHWGDDQLPDDDPRQEDFLGFKKYTGGPTGPYDKKLNRSKTCPDADAPCVEWDFLPPGS